MKRYFLFISTYLLLIGTPNNSAPREIGSDSYAISPAIEGLPERIVDQLITAIKISTLYRDIYEAIQDLASRAQVLEKKMVEQKTSCMEKNDLLENKITALEFALEHEVLELIQSIQKTKVLQSEKEQFIEKLDYLLTKQAYFTTIPETR